MKIYNLPFRSCGHLGFSMTPSVFNCIFINTKGVFQITDQAVGKKDQIRIKSTKKSGNLLEET